MTNYDRPNVIALVAIHFSVLLFVISGDKIDTVFPIFFSILIMYLIYDYGSVFYTLKNKKDIEVFKEETVSIREILTKNLISNIVIGLATISFAFAILTKMKFGPIIPNFIGALAVSLSCMTIFFLCRLFLEVELRNKEFRGSRVKLFAMVLFLGVVSVEVIRSSFVL